MSEKFLKVEDLVVEYRTGGKVVHAVNNVSFELERGKTLGLVGETGAGKTTMIKLLMRFYDVNAGSIKVFKKMYKMELSAYSQRLCGV